MRDRKFTQLMAGLKDRVEPDQTWSTETKNFLLAQIPAAKPAWGLNLVTHLIPVNLVLRPVAAFSLVLALVFISSFASVNASRNSLPGDVLYPVKLTAENLKYTLSFSDEGKARAAMSMVENRISELKKITLMDDSAQVKQAKIGQATNEITNNLKIVADKMQQLDNNQASNEQEKAKVSMAVKEINDKLINIKQEMQVAMDASLDNEVDQQIEKLTSEIEKTSTEVMAVLKDELVISSVNNEGESATSTNIIIGNATSTNTTTVNTYNGTQEAGTSSDDFIKQLLEETNREVKEPEFKVGIIQ